MPNQHLAGALELLLADEPPPGSQRIVVLPRLPGTGLERLVDPLFAAVPGRRRLLPAPPPDAPPSHQRVWHRDVWLALGDSERASLAVATGPTAAHLGRVLGEEAEIVAFLREPLVALAGVRSSGLPIKRIVAFATGEEGDPPEHLRPWSNPQSRALLAPWHDTDALAVTAEPPDDADRWRELLFEDVLPRMSVTGNARAFARRVAVTLGRAPKRSARAATALFEEADAYGGPGPDPRHHDLLRSMSWLDVELYSRAS